MKYKTNFFKKAITSIYDIKVFSNYAKEGIFKSILYSMILTFILSGVSIIFTIDRINNLEFKSFIAIIIINFATRFFNLLFNCLIVALVASIFTIFMKMIVKYMALYSVILYAATLPLIAQVILETINSNIKFDTMFIIGTLTYVMLILKYIKDEIIKNLS